MLRPRWDRRSFFVVCQTSRTFVMDDRVHKRRWSVPPANPALPVVRRESFSFPASLLEWREAHCEQGDGDRRILPRISCNGSGGITGLAGGNRPRDGGGGHSEGRPLGDGQTARKHGQTENGPSPVQLRGQPGSDRQRGEVLFPRRRLRSIPDADRSGLQAAQGEFAR